jgi:hypothetical protein
MSNTTRSGIIAVVVGILLSVALVLAERFGFWAGYPVAIAATGLMMIIDS